MNFLVITDTHGIFNAVYNRYKDQIGDVDVVVLLGDHSNTDYRQIEAYFEGKLIFYVNGNHDSPYDSPCGICLHKQVAGPYPRFAGLSGSHKYKPSQYYGYEQNESVQVAKEIPQADILFAHDGPKGYGLVEDGAHEGLKGILWYIKHHKPKTVIYGHHHKTNHYFIGDTKCFCVYQLALFNIDNNGKVLNVKTFEPL